MSAINTVYVFEATQSVVLSKEAIENQHTIIYTDYQNYLGNFEIHRFLWKPPQLILIQNAWGESRNLYQNKSTIQTKRTQICDSEVELDLRPSIQENQYGENFLMSNELVLGSSLSLINLLYIYWRLSFLFCKIRMLDLTVKSRS